MVWCSSCGNCPLLSVLFFLLVGVYEEYDFSHVCEEHYFRSVLELLEWAQG